MKQIISEYSEDLKPVKVYLDDLEKIVAILNETNQRVEIIIGNYMLDNVEELKQIKEEVLYNMTIRVCNPYISVNLRPNNARIYISEDTTISRGILGKIKDVLIRRKRHIAYVNLFYITSGISFITGIFLSYSYNSKYFFIWLIGLALTLFLILLNCIICGKYSIIIPKYKIDAPSFFKRNSDKIIIGIITAIIIKYMCGLFRLK